MGGGATVVVSGENMDGNNSANVLTGKATVMGTTVQLPFPALTENDAFNSNAMGGRLSYKLPSVMTLFNKTWSDFNGAVLPNGKSATIQFTMDVHTTSKTLDCASTNNCKINFQRDYTPLLLDMTPANIYGGQEVQYNVYGRNVLH